MGRSVHLNDRNAAYHVPNRQATDICHLRSPFFQSLFLASEHTPKASRMQLKKHKHTHTLFRRSAESPLSKASLPLISVITQTVCRSTPPSSAARWKRNKTDGEGQEEDRADDSFIREGSYVLIGAALAAKTFLWHVSDWYVEVAAHSAEVMEQFLSSADWKMRN